MLTSSALSTRDEVPVAKAAAIWFATEVVVPDLFTRTVDSLGTDDEIRRLTSAVRDDGSGLASLPKETHADAF